MQASYPTSYGKGTFGSVEIFHLFFTCKARGNFIIPFHADSLLIEGLAVNHSNFHSTEALSSGQELEIIHLCGCFLGSFISEVTASSFGYILSW